MKDEILNIKTRQQFYIFLKKNHDLLKELFIEVKLGNPNNISNCLSYLDAVEVALCFGWIDSTKKVINGKLIQRFSPRKKNSMFTELNKERCRRLIKLKQMDESGFKVLPKLDEYKATKYLIKMIVKNKEAYDFFTTTPKIYQNIKLSTLDSYYKKDKNVFKKSFSYFIKKCEKHMIYGSYDDYGRLSEY